MCLGVVLSLISQSHQHQHQMESHGLASMEKSQMGILDSELVLFMGLKVFKRIISLLGLQMPTIWAWDILFITQHAIFQSVMDHSVVNLSVLVDMDLIMSKEHAHHVLGISSAMDQLHAFQDHLIVQSATQ